MYTRRLVTLVWINPQRLMSLSHHSLLTVFTDYSLIYIRVHVVVLEKVILLSVQLMAGKYSGKK